MNQRRRLLGALALSTLASRAGWAQGGYPNRAVKLVVPSTPGGATDIIGRLVGTRLAAAWSQPVVIDNRPGAGTSIGAEYVAKAPPDGYTLLLAGIASHAINPALYKTIGYDPVKSFTPITLVGTLSNVLLASPSFPASTVQELVELVRANPGKYSYASVGNGTSPHLSGELLCQLKGLKMVHVPYKGSASATNDLLGGQIQLGFDNLSSGLPFIRDGKLKALAVTTRTRSPMLPDVPTFAEAGVAGFDVTSWAALMAPAGLPAPVLQRISQDAMAMLREPEVVRSLLEVGVSAHPMTPTEFGAFVASEGAKYRGIVTRANLQIG